MSPSRFFTGFHSNVDTVIVDDDMEEVYIEDAASSNEFDSIIGAIEDVVIDDEFQDLQKNLLKIYNHHFEDTEENKLIYTEIYQVYTTEIENYIEAKLSQRFPNFSMDRFLTQLSERKDTLDGDIFELLYSLSDFLIFKEMFVDYKIMKGKTNQEDLSDLLCVSAIKN